MEDIKLESIKLIANKLKRQRIEKHESLIHRVVNEYFIRKGKSFLKNEFSAVDSKPIFKTTSSCILTLFHGGWRLIDLKDGYMKYEGHVLLKI